HRVVAGDASEGRGGSIGRSSAEWPRTETAAARQARAGPQASTRLTRQSDAGVSQDPAREQGAPPAQEEPEALGGHTSAPGRLAWASRWMLLTYRCRSDPGGRDGRVPR